jgi:oligopeptidase B
MTEPVPPVAKRVPVPRTRHGDTVVDDYAWLADRSDPDTVAYLTAENAFTDAVTAHLAGLRETVFEEIKARTQETDLSVPVRQGGWWYYSRSEEGRQYGIRCRRAAAPGETDPPSTADGGPLPGEQVLLDANALAEGHDFLGIGTYDVSPDGRRLAYSTDFAGDERFTIRIKDLDTGELLADEIPNTAYGSAWSADASVLFYLTVDEAWRPHRVWRHVVGKPVDEDRIVFEDTDERFWVDVELTRSAGYVLISSESKTSGDVRAVPAGDPLAEPVLIAPRRDGVEYSVDHRPGQFLVLHNDGAEDFALASTPDTAPGEWTTLVPHQPGRRLLGADAFADHVVLSLRADGLTRLRVLPDGGEPYDVAFPEPLYTVRLDSTPEYTATAFRLAYTSLVTPDSIYDCDAATGALVLRKQTPVRGGYDPAGYEQHREFATAADGTQVPVSIVCRRGTPRDGSAPCVLYGYGSYESTGSTDPRFSVARLSLLDRGVVYAIGHVRGGGEGGRRWYLDGKLLRKKNTFTDFAAVAAHLAGVGWTAPDRLVARGGSAGGLLVGAVSNLAPEAFAAIVAHVPFVDPLNTILDPSLPLTVTEWEEWGNPVEDAEVYAYMKSYSPYENVDAGRRPAILALTSLNDTRVLFHEPAKWVARLRAVSPDTPVLLRTEMHGGHGGPSGKYNTWREEAFVLAWLLDLLGAG